MVVGDPQGDLPSARREARALCLDRSWRCLVGSDASVAAVSDALVDTRWWHFAGHGQMVGDHPLSASLSLGDGGEMALPELLQTRRAIGGAFLHGCSTGRPSSRRGIAGLPEALLVATGARAVVATMRPVAAGAGALFVRTFYAADVGQPGPAFVAAVRASIDAGDGAWRDYRLFGPLRGTE